MWFNKKYKAYRPNKREETYRMLQNKISLLEKAEKSPTELRFWNTYAKPFMERTGIKITKQARRWYRIFDFRVPSKWLAIEIDWGYHTGKQKRKDNHYDKYNYERSWIITLRVPNRDNEKALEVMQTIEQEISWRDRRRNLWVQTKAEKKKDTQNLFGGYCSF